MYHSPLIDGKPVSVLLNGSAFKQNSQHTVDANTDGMFPLFVLGIRGRLHVATDLNDLESSIRVASEDFDHFIGVLDAVLLGRIDPPSPPKIP